MKIFGIGLSRTGTSSLNDALKVLGYKAIHYPKPSLFPELIQVMKHCDAGTDTPITLAYKELDKAFPDSKFILTTRSLQSWLVSCENFRHFRIALKDERKYVRLGIYKHNGFHKRKFKQAYFRHHKDVYEYFRMRDDLLIIDFTKGEGWEELCEFLNKEIPDIPFPHSNKSKGRLRRR